MRAIPARLFFVINHYLFDIYFSKISKRFVPLIFLSFFSHPLRFCLKRKCLRMKLRGHMQVDRESMNRIGAKPWPRPNDYKTS